MFGQELSSLTELCDKEHVQIEWIVPIPLAHDGMTANDTLTKFFEENDADDIAKIFGEPLASFVKQLQKDDPDAGDRERLEAILEFMGNDINGTLISIRMPVRKYDKPTDGSFQFSYGHCYTGTFYVTSFDEFVTKLNAFVADRVKKCKNAKPNHKR